MATVTTTVTELPESRVRVEAEVAADEVERRLAQTARQLGRQMKLPGFRKGKVPTPMVIQRVGRGAVLDEAVRDSLPGWYVEAIDRAGIAPVGEPEVNLTDLPGEGQPLRFSIEIGVRPTAQLGQYRGLEVGRREPDVPAEAVDRELEAMRDRLGRLETVAEPAAEGDFVVLDYAGTVDGEPIEGGEARDQLVELGGGQLAPEMESALAGAVAGDTRQVDVAFGADHPNPALAGRSAAFEIAVKEVKRKDLPELDDDFAADAAGFDSMEELREDLRAKLEEADRRAIDAEFREAAVDAAVAQASVDVPEPLVEARARELWARLSRDAAASGDRPRRLPAHLGQDRGGDRRRRAARRRARAAPRSGAGGGGGGRGHRALRGGAAGGARALGRAREDHAGQAAGAPAGGGPGRDPGRRPGHPQRRRPAGRRGRADLGRSGGRAGEAVDAGQRGCAGFGRRVQRRRDGDSGCARQAVDAGFLSARGPTSTGADAGGPPKGDC